MVDDSEVIVPVVSTSPQIVKASNGVGNNHHNHQQQHHNNVKENATTEDFQPPDGGVRAWTILVSAFLCNGVIFGIINTYGVIYLKLQEQMKENGDAEASSKAGEWSDKICCKVIPNP